MSMFNILRKCHSLFMSTLASSNYILMLNDEELLKLRKSNNFHQKNMTHKLIT